MVTNVTREKVTAIVVCHGRDLSFLGKTLHGLSAQTHQPDRIVAVIPNHDSEAVQPIHEHLDTDSESVQLVAATGENLGQIVSELQIDDGDWLWFLHADSAPEPEALDELLRHGETSKRIAVVGPKQIAWDDDGTPVVLEVGIRATRTARRVPEIEANERDQGQYDSRTDVLAVGTAGMLVRRSTFEELGGFDPNLGPFGDGLEFSRRARRAGYRVVVEPKAIVRHARAGLGEDIDSTYARRRSAQLYNALLAAPGPLVPLMIVLYVLVAPVRAIHRLIFKEPALAWAELGGVASMVGSLGALKRGRRHLATVSKVGPDALAELEARPAEIRDARKESRRSKKEAKFLAEQPDPLTIKARADFAMHTRRGAAVTLVMAVLFAIIFHLNTFAAGVLSGGGLATDTTQGVELARIAWSGWLDSGDGHALPLDPLWVVSLPFLLLGQPLGLTLGGLATAIIYLAIPAAAVFAYLAAGRLTTSWVARTVLATLWIVAPPFLDALHTGQIGAVVAHTLLPLAVSCVMAAWRGSAPAFGLAALTFGALASAAPVYLGVACVLALIGVAFNKGRRKRWLWLPVPALMFLAPTLRTYSDPYLVFSQAGVPTGSESARAMIDAIAGDMWSWIPLAVVVAVATLALLRIHRMWWIRAGWLVAAFGIVHATASQYANVATRSVAGGYETIEASPHIGLSIGWFGLWFAIGSASHALRTVMRTRNFGATQIIGGMAMIALPIATFAGGGRWLLHINDVDPILGTHTPAIPALADEAFDQHERVLALTMSSDGVAGELWRGHGQELHEFTMARGLSQADSIVVAHENGFGVGDEASIDLSDVTMGLLTGSDGAAHTLGEHAVSVVLIPPLTEGESAEFRAELIGRVQTVPGLQYVTDGASGTFWRVSEPSTRVFIPEGHTRSGVIHAEADVAETAEARELRLAERTNEHWQASIDGTVLDPTVLDPTVLESTVLDPTVLEPSTPSWYQTWTVPAGTAGTVEITYNDPGHRALMLAGGFALVASLVVALPIRRRKGGLE